MLHICHADLQKGMEFMNMTAMRNSKGGRAR